MTMRKINELPQKEFTGDMIDHCFYVENMNQPEMRLVPLSSIFDRIKEEATKSGLTVKMEGEKIMFISKDNNMKKESLVYCYDCLKDAMEIIDDYLNAGTKEERTKAHKKAKELYKYFHGKDFVNRSERENNRLTWRLHLKADVNFVLLKKTELDYIITQDYFKGMVFKTKNHALKFAKDHNLNLFEPGSSIVFERSFRNNPY